MQKPAGKSPAEAAAAAQAAIEQFLAACRQPALLEPGEAQLALDGENLTLEWRSGRLTLQAWDAGRNLARRITGIGEQKPGSLELKIERFGKREGQAFLIDLARRPQMERRGERLVFREQFRRFLSRRFPDWKIAELSSEPNLEESLSPAYPRALLNKGAAAWAAIACPPDAGAGAGVLTFGLIWMDYLRRRERRRSIEGLILFLALGHERTTALRLPFLDPATARTQFFVYSEEGDEERLDPRDCGNLDTRLDPCRGPHPAADVEVSEWVDRLRRAAYVETVERNDGSLSLRVRGLEFARAARGALLFGLERSVEARPENLPEIERLAAEIARLRSPGAPDHGHPLYRMRPEGWLESRVRAHIEALDSSLLALPVYGQVPAMAGGERGLIDLLAAGRDGRLAVLELKASEDIHLPLQSLDYWMRVQWHLERGEFAERGYFPGIELRRQPPRLLLVAPALDFHPKTEAVLRYLSPAVDVERIGLGVEWRKEPKIMFRMRGAERPL
jgi:hypothetical protein